VQVVCAEHQVNLSLYDRDTLRRLTGVDANAPIVPLQGYVSSSFN